MLLALLAVSRGDQQSGRGSGARRPRDTMNMFDGMESAGYGGGAGPMGGVVLSRDPKPRLRWTPDLHERFVEAVTKLGGADSEYTRTPHALIDLLLACSLLVLLPPSPPPPCHAWMDFSDFRHSPKLPPVRCNSNDANSTMHAHANIPKKHSNI